MGLIDAERDDAAVLAAEDEAIRAMSSPPEVHPVPVGTSLASLIESLTNAEAPQVPPEDRQG